MLRNELLLCVFRANMYIPKGKTNNENGGNEHEKNHKEVN